QRASHADWRRGVPRAARDRRDHLEGDRRRLAGGPPLRAAVHLARHLEPGLRPRGVRRPQLRDRNARDVARRDGHSCAALDRDRSLPHRARARRDSRADRVARRDARGGPERRRRPLGHPRARPVHALRDRAVPALRIRLDPALLRRPAAERRARRDRRPHDDGAPDHLLGLPRALPQRAAGREGGGDRPRCDALGDGARRRRLQRSRRRHRRRHPRPRAGARRSDRGHAGDRHLARAVPHLALPVREHAGEPDRVQLPGSGDEPPGRLARLPRADPARDHVRRELRGAADRAPLRVRADGGLVSEPVTLQARGRARRRLRVNRTAELASVLAALVAVGFLAILVGTLLLVLIATAIALPVGVLVALYVSEFAPPRIANQIKLWLDVLNGFPSIVIGIFVFALAVKTKVPLLGIGHHQSVFAGSFALSIIMLPLVARTTMEVLALVPNSLREASYALGVSKWRTVLSVIVPSALGGIVTGTTLAVARAAGETAPLLFTCAIAGQLVNWDPSLSTASIPVTIFEYSESPDRHLNAQAWAAAFVLIAFVLVTSLVSRVLLERQRRKLGRAS